MANQKTNDGNRSPQGVTTQRGGGPQEQQSLARRSSGGRALGRISQQNPFVMMRRMLDDLDTSSYLSPLSWIGGGSPFATIRRMFDGMERMFEDLGVSEQIEQRVFEWAPRVDVTLRDENLIVHADLPGIPQDKIKIFAQDGSLVIEGEREQVSEGQTGDVWQSERSYGRFRRVLPLPEGADIDNAVARFDNGVLEVSVRLPEGRRGRRIEIQGAGAKQVQGGQVPVQNQPAGSQPAERH